MKRYKLPRLHYYGGFVRPKDLDKLPDEMPLMVDSSLVCAAVHSWKGEDKSGMSPQFRKLYDKFDNMLFGDNPVAFGKPIKMQVKDIKTFFVKTDNIPLTCLKLTSDDLEISRKREEIEEYKRNLIDIGSVNDLLKALAPHSFSERVIMNLNKSKLQVLVDGKRKDLM